MASEQGEPTQKFRNVQSKCNTNLFVAGKHFNRIMHFFTSILTVTQKEKENENILFSMLTSILTVNNNLEHKNMRIFSSLSSLPF